MLTIKKTTEGQNITLELSGAVDELFNLKGHVPTPPANLRLILREVKRINSVGVKNWMRFLSELTAAGTKIVLAECSTAIVEQINFVSNFACGATIESVFSPFLCVGCKSQMQALFKTTDLKKAWRNIPPLKCPKCGGQAEFDDLPEEFFGFLSRENG